MEAILNECFDLVRAGTHADSQGFARVLGFLTTVAGMLVFALMIGVVSATIGARVDDLKRGSAKVQSRTWPHSGGDAALTRTRNPRVGGNSWLKNGLRAGNVGCIVEHTVAFHGRRQSMIGQSSWGRKGSANWDC